MIAFIERLLELRFKFNITRDYVRRRHSLLTLLKKNNNWRKVHLQSCSGGVAIGEIRDILVSVVIVTRHVYYSTQKRRYT
jgi:hypothetical protein